jgi:hypothetical protein
MNSSHVSKQKGVIGTIVLIVVALIILGYYGINFKTVVTSPLVQENLSYAWELFINGVFNGFTAVVEFVKGIIH